MSKLTKTRGQLIIFLLLFSQLVFFQEIGQINGKDYPIEYEIVFGYTEENPIEITDNAGLASYASEGDGNPGTPYILSGMNISTKSEFKALYIHGSSVTAYFIIISETYMGFFHTNTQFF